MPETCLPVGACLVVEAGPLVGWAVHKAVERAGAVYSFDACFLISKWEMYTTIVQYAFAELQKSVCCNS